MRRCERRRNAEQAFFEFIPLDATPAGAAQGAIDVNAEPKFPNTRIYRDFEFGKHVKSFEERLESHAVRQGWFAERPEKVRDMEKIFARTGAFTRWSDSAASMSFCDSGCTSQNDSVKSNGVWEMAQKFA